MPGNATDRGRRWVPAGLVAAGAALALLACVHDTVEPTQTVWESVISGTPEYADVTGTAAAVSANGATQASIQLGGVPGGSYRWGVHRGTCEVAGSLLGEPEAYPALNVGLDGSVTGEATFTRFMQGGGEFIALVLTSGGTRVACGEFLPWS